jgi:hypothetical protein
MTIRSRIKEIFSSGQTVHAAQPQLNSTPNSTVIADRCVPEALARLVMESWMPAELKQQVTDEVMRIMNDRSFDAAKVEVGVLLVSPNTHVTLSYGDKYLLPIFSSRHLADDYIRANRLIASPAGLTLDHLYELLKTSEQIAAITIDRCPRCEVTWVALIQHLTSPEDILYLCTIRDVVRALLFKRDFAAAQSEADLQKRKTLLLQIRDHIHPGASDVHLHLGLVAIALSDQQLLKECRDRLTSINPAVVEALDLLQKHRSTKFD